MLHGIHFLLTYTCNYSCDHCFLYCSPETGGVFTAGQIGRILDGAKQLSSIDTVFFEGGEPFLYYPLMLEGIRLARERGFEVGIVTNAYWATTVEDALLWLTPLKRLEVGDISLSDDIFHYGEQSDTPPKNACLAAERLGLDVDFICIDAPSVKMRTPENGKAGDPVVGGGTSFRGRAVEKLTAGLPLRPPETMTACLQEVLDYPSRVHIDPFGHVHVCQGISIGNVFEKPIGEIMAEYRPETHPICSAILAGGPVKLAEDNRVPLETGYVDACHLCFKTRLALLDRYPKFLAPRQVYGLEPE